MDKVLNIQGLGPIIQSESYNTDKNTIQNKKYPNIDLTRIKWKNLSQNAKLSRQQKDVYATYKIRFNYTKIFLQMLLCFFFSLKTPRDEIVLFEIISFCRKEIQFLIF